MSDDLANLRHALRCSEVTRDALVAEVERLRWILRWVLEGSVIVDETDDGQRILLDLHTEPAKVLRVDD